MQRAIDETNRRRTKQIAFNKIHGITPRGIRKKVADIMEGARRAPDEFSAGKKRYKDLWDRDKYSDLSPEHGMKLVKKLEQKMYQHARDLEFEEAARIRDEVFHLKDRVLGKPQKIAG